MFFLLCLLLLLIIFCYVKHSQQRGYWRKYGVDSVEPLPIFGSMLPVVLRTKSFAELFGEIYNKFSDKRYGGYYQFLQPTLLVKDPDLIKQITIKDFDVFPNHTQFTDESVDPLWAKNLFSVQGQKWRDLRSTLSPAFTSSKMRNMFVFIDEVALQMMDYIKQQDKEICELELKDTFTRFANDVIATTAFGVKCDSLKHKNNEFYLMGKDGTDFSGFRGLKFFGAQASPTLMKLFNIKMTTTKTANFFYKLIKNNIKERKEKGITRPDMIHLLLEARKNNLQYDDQENICDTGFSTAQESEIGKQSHKTPKAILTDEDITAQAFVFFLGGFEVTSTLLCTSIYELGVNPDVQAMLHKEVEEAWGQCGGKLTYEVLMKMKYLDMVVTETIRKWPPVMVDRKSVKPYVIKASKPDEKDVYLPVGSVIILPIWGLHRDPKHYPDPEKFDPERFNDENKPKINANAYIPFGIGPRNCIGSRFALLESKIVIAHILHNFEIVPTFKTQIPLRLCKKSVNLQAEHGYWLGFKKRC